MSKIGKPIREITTMPRPIPVQLPKPVVKPAEVPILVPNWPMPVEVPAEPVRKT